MDIKDLMDPTKFQRHLPELESYFEAGGTWQKLMKVSDEAMKEHYARGYAQYKEGEYDEAIQCFTALTILDPYKKEFWFGLGAAHEMVGKREEAIDAYEMCLAIDEENQAAKKQLENLSG